MQTNYTETQVFEQLSRYPVVPVFYNDDLALSTMAIQACYDGGIRAFEWVARGQYAEAHFPLLLEYIAAHCPEMILGAGTILTDKQAEAFIEMGAAFLVSPMFSNSVLDQAYFSKVAYLPGCFTPTEIFNAHQAGCQWVKVFPGDAVSPAYIKSIKAVLPQVNIMVTGGVKPEKENVQNWLANGASAVGMGSQLFKVMEAGAIKNTVAALFS
jgi:2-dehydro-3-deoxyphosphogluconate aldolase / (4S)-4-hydroxy-2-oxoglutarate aldolase